jgi:hypothetical protein
MPERFYSKKTTFVSGTMINNSLRALLQSRIVQCKRNRERKREKEKDSDDRLHVLLFPLSFFSLGENRKANNKWRFLLLFELITPLALWWLSTKWGKGKRKRRYTVLTHMPCTGHGDQRNPNHSNQLTAKWDNECTARNNQTAKAPSLRCTVFWSTVWLAQSPRTWASMSFVLLFSHEHSLRIWRISVAICDWSFGKEIVGYPSRRQTIIS